MSAIGAKRTFRLNAVRRIGVRVNLTGVCVFACRGPAKKPKASLTRNEDLGRGPHVERLYDSAQRNYAIGTPWIRHVMQNELQRACGVG
jgi:hypothetical protein